ncbi:MAG: response regulator transcription factor [Clostridiales bacterium]|jgi:two-component system response regulator YesN|nr:response regulator transcription factor [Clostridiales bacterium]
MYKVIIVDDEPIIRHGLKNKIDWALLGFECIAACENGREAQEYIEKTRPDLVITDIKMPFVDGLALTEYIKEIDKNIKVIILSGYDEFEYARKAIKFGVNDYIVKPITASEMMVVLEKLKNEIDKEKKENEAHIKKEKLLDDNKLIIKERFLQELVSLDINAEKIISHLGELGVDLSGSSYVAAIIDVDEGFNKIGLQENPNDPVLYFSVFNITEEIINNDKLGVTFQDSELKTVVIFCAPDTGIMELAKNTCYRVQNTVKSIMNFTVSIGVGEYRNSPDAIAESYKEALNALEYRFLMGSGKIISISGVSINVKNTASDIITVEPQIIEGIKDGREDVLINSVGDLFNIIKNAHLSVEGAYEVLYSLIFKIQKTMEAYDVNDIFETRHNIISDIYRYKTLDEIEIWLIEVCCNIMQYLNKKKEKYTKQLILKAEDFIRENYSDPKISINSVSKELSLSPSYFSALFKNLTNKTFTEYLTNARIEKAKGLLASTSLKTYEIAYKVGYSDPHYFSIAFKKGTGRSPTKYREGLS